MTTSQPTCQNRETVNQSLWHLPFCLAPLRNMSPPRDSSWQLISKTNPILTLQMFSICDVYSCVQQLTVWDITLSTVHERLPHPYAPYCCPHFDTLPAVPQDTVRTPASSVQCRCVHVCENCLHMLHSYYARPEIVTSCYMYSHTSAVSQHCIAHDHRVLHGSIVPFLSVFYLKSYLLLLVN